MSATSSQYLQLFGAVCGDVAVMARCACVACNTCTCACSCRVSSESEEIEW